MLFLLILFITAVLCLVFYLSSKNSNYWGKQNVVQIPDIMIKFMFGKESMPEIVQKIYNDYDEPYIGMTTGTIPTLLVKSPEDVQAVLAGEFQSFHSRGIIDPNPNDLLADNLIFINNFQRWKILRQKLSPVFTSAKLKNMFYILDKCGRDFVDFLEDNLHLRQKPFNVLYTYTTSSIGAAVFGIDTQTKNTMESPFLDMAWKTLEPSRKQNVVILIANVFPALYKLLKLKIFGEFEEFFVGAVKSVLQNRRHETAKRHDFIDICLELQKHGVMQDFTTGYELEPSDEVLAAQAFFFFIAGADTSANTMHYTLLELSNNPQILKKLHEEIDSIFESGSEELSYNDIEKMTYLDKVLNEAMRKYPPIGVIQKLCTKDTYLPSGVQIAKDDIIIVPVFALHRDEKYFPNPDVFDPERFAAGSDAKTNNYVYLPFGEGNRICIGNRFARLQVKVGLAWLLRRFTLGEQNGVIPTFERSPFGLRSPTARYELKLRDV